MLSDLLSFLITLFYDMPIMVWRNMLRPVFKRKPKDDTNN
jgi:hypothetical protein